MSSLNVKSVDRTLMHVPFHEINQPHMARWQGDWQVVELCALTASNGLVGYGETIVNYTHGRVTDESVAKVTGQNPWEHLWDDSLGAGLQIALFDLCGKSAGVPCHRLLGQQVRDEAPISYWDQDMPAEDWAKEAERAVSLGYTSFKLKARPWRDLDDCIRAVCEVAPRQFHLDLDYNAHLLNAGNAVPHLLEIGDYPNVAMFESPIPQGDVKGGLLIKKQVPQPIAHHYGQPPIITALTEDVCDGFVIGGGASRVRTHATVAAEASKPFWLQLVGTGITTTWAVHQGVVYTHAQWPAITCHELYTDDLLTERLDVRAGYIRVPEAPGMGVEIDLDAVERHRVEEPPLRMPFDLICAVWESGRRAYYRDKYHAREDFMAGNQPVFEAGVRLELLKDDGSEEFADLKARVQEGAVVSHER